MTDSKQPISLKWRPIFYFILAVFLRSFVWFWYGEALVDALFLFFKPQGLIQMIN